jgi:hypothetical protein
MLNKTKDIKIILLAVMVSALSALILVLLPSPIVNAELGCAPGYGPNENESACIERDEDDATQGSKINCPDGKIPGNKPGEANPDGEVCIDDPAYLGITPSFEGDCEPGADDTGKQIPVDSSNCGIIGYLVTGINILSSLVGVVVVIMIAIGGIQYSVSRDNPQAVQAAKSRIMNAILALVAYMFMYGFLQWIVPGGVL